MRLRPFGDSGPLVMSFAALEDYYQEQGRDWERYAMVKARLMGGAEDAYSQELRKTLRPFVFRRYIDFSVIQSLRNMKGMIAREVRRRGLKDNIKLGAGGIREIEFITQVFQLIRGGREPALQGRSLPPTLQAVGELGLLEAEQVRAERRLPVPAAAGESAAGDRRSANPDAAAGCARSGAAGLRHGAGGLAGADGDAGRAHAGGAGGVR